MSASLPDKGVAIVAVTRNGAGLALQLQAKIEGSRCYVPTRHTFALAMGAHGYERLGDIFPAIWKNHGSIVCVMAAGIVVRLVAPLLRNKTVDPAVVVMDEQGRFVISLLSGHIGGANRLAEEVARIVGGQAVVTTASDVEGMLALDLVARDAGLEVENPEMLSHVSRGLLEGDAIRIWDPENRLLPYLDGLLNILPLGGPGTDASPSAGGGLSIWVSESYPPVGDKWLLFRPRNLVVGIGCNRGADASEILGLLHEVFDRERLSPLSIRNFASIDIKSDEVGLLEAASAVGRPIRFFSRQEIEGVTVPNPSAVVAAHTGVQSVCEATALLSCRSGKLIVQKRKTSNATLAVARVDSPS